MSKSAEEDLENNLYGPDLIQIRIDFLKNFDILSKQDAFKIFTACESGIESKGDAYKKLNISKKQFYTRLGQLLDLGLIVRDKEDKTYVHTQLGYEINETLKKAYKIYKSLLDIGKLPKNEFDERLKGHTKLDRYIRLKQQGI